MCASTATATPVCVWRGEKTRDRGSRESRQAGTNKPAHTPNNADFGWIPHQPASFTATQNHTPRLNGIGCMTQRTLKSSSAVIFHFHTQKGAAYRNSGSPSRCFCSEEGRVVSTCVCKRDESSGGHYIPTSQKSIGMTQHRPAPQHECARMHAPRVFSAQTPAPPPSGRTSQSPSTPTPTRRRRRLLPLLRSPRCRLPTGDPMPPPPPPSRTWRPPCR